MKTLKIKLILLASIICTLLNISVLAAEYDSDVVVSLQIDNPIMEINGTSTEIDTGRGTSPVIFNGRTLVPVRAIIEAFSGTVTWEAESNSAILKMNGDTVKLTVDSTTAYCNNVPHTLDTAPSIINDRTMLPIRFVAESFNLGVAWDNNTRTVYIIRNSFDNAEYQYLMSVIPPYNGSPYEIINGNVPLFKEYEIIPASFEYYSSLDDMGRCDVCMASVDTDLMPTTDRESIASVTPTGWINRRYDVVPGGYLYNRCHLIGYQLTGENNNSRNLITGTRYLNIEGMLPIENMVDDYVEQTGNCVMYRVTPVFKGNNLVADGVLMEAFSVEDNGDGISLCVYCYNVQPQIAIDYLTGESHEVESVTSANRESTNASATVNGTIFRTPTGKRYHLDPECGGKNSYQTTLEEATADGLTPCQKCTI